jgi:CBS domain-containing protein
MKAADVMTRTVITVRPQTSLAEAVKRMLENGVSGLVVVDERERVVGILSEGDLLRRAETQTERRRPHWLEFLLGPARLAHEFVRAHGRIIEEVMSPEVITVEEDTPLGEIVELFEERGIKRVPVLRDEELVGIVSRADLLRALLDALAAQAQEPANDEAIRAQVVAEIAKAAWLPREGIVVAVKDGIVTLEGVILDAKEGDALRVIAENVPGVKAVRDRLVWVEPVSGSVVESAPGEDES